MNVELVEVLYCEGWDAEGRTAVGHLSTLTAAERDRMGRPYAVVFSADRPLMVLEVAWEDYYCGIWLLDDKLRRTHQIQFRRLEADRIFLLERKEWHHSDPSQAEFDEHAGSISEISTVDGGVAIMEQPGGVGGGARQTFKKVPLETLWHHRPEFGDWGPLLAFLSAAGHDMSGRPVLFDASPQEDSSLAASERPWQPPRPLAPTRLAEMFNSGARLSVSADEPATMEVSHAGILHLPSGRLVVADPTWLRPVHEESVQPFIVSVAPGDYPLNLAVARFADPGHCRVAAARLTIRDEPVVSWELALRPGQDIRILGLNEFFGVGVDAGMACFYDAAAATSLTALVEASWDTFVLPDRDTAVQVTDPISDANLITFSTGWGDGSYPTWIGRVATGQVGCFVLDMLLFD